MMGPMVWTSLRGKAMLYLPDSVKDADDLKMVEKAIALQMRSWKRGMLAEIASRWPFPDPEPRGDEERKS